MITNLHLMFAGNCREAFQFYEQTFGSKVLLTMTFGEAPGGSPVPKESDDRVMHTAMPLGTMTLMGGDAPCGQEKKMSGFHVSVDSSDEDEVRRLFAALSEGGRVEMALVKTFWSPLFGMVEDRFGVGWILSVQPG